MHKSFFWSSNNTGQDTHIQDKSTWNAEKVWNLDKSTIWKISTNLSGATAEFRRYISILIGIVLEYK